MEIFFNGPKLIIKFVLDHQKSLQKRDSTEDSTKRSRSLDSDQTLSTNVSKQLEKGKSKSAWSKVKGMVKTHRTSLKTVSRSSTSNQMSLEGSRDVSPCESIDLGIVPFDVSIFLYKFDLYLQCFNSHI